MIYLNSQKILSFFFFNLVLRRDFFFIMWKERDTKNFFFLMKFFFQGIWILYYSRWWWQWKLVGGGGSFSSFSFGFGSAENSVAGGVNTKAGGPHKAKLRFEAGLQKYADGTDVGGVEVWNFTKLRSSTLPVSLWICRNYAQKRACAFRFFGQQKYDNSKTRQWNEKTRYHVIINFVCLQLELIVVIWAFQTNCEHILYSLDLKNKTK